MSISKIKTSNGAEHNITPYYATCKTAADVAAKTVSIDGFELQENTHLIIHFENANMAQDPTLAINDGVASPIHYEGEAPSGATESWRPGAYIAFIYDGKNWNLIGTVSGAEEDANAKLRMYRRKSDYNDSVYPVVLSDTRAHEIGTPGEKDSCSSIFGMFYEGEDANLPTIYANPAQGVLYASSFVGKTDAGQLEGVVPVSSGGLGTSNLKEAKKNLGITYGTSVPTGVPVTGEGTIYFFTDDPNPIAGSGSGSGGGSASKPADLGIMDHVTEMVINDATAGDGGWSWRKWNSGFVECWKKYSVSASHYSTVGNFYGYNGKVRFPITFKGVPQYTYNVQVGSGFAMPGSATMGATTSETNWYALATASGTQIVTVNIYVWGQV